MSRSAPAWPLLACLLAGCTGTPMPIPPSFAPEEILAEPSAETPDCPEGCVVVSGGETAAEPGATLLVHRLDVPIAAEPPLPTTLLAGLTRADASGAFSVLLGGGPDGAFRAIVHGDEGTVVADFVLDTARLPWTARARPDAGPAACVAFAPEALDFGSLAAGSTETAVVEVTNGCEGELMVTEATVLAGDDSGVGDAFGAMPRRSLLMPGETTTVVIAFWPDAPGSYRGALLLRLDAPAAPPGGLTLLPSLPVRGSAR